MCVCVYIYIYIYITGRRDVVEKRRPRSESVGAETSL